MSEEKSFDGRNKKPRWDAPDGKKLGDAFVEVRFFEFD